MNNNIDFSAVSALLAEAQKTRRKRTAKKPEITTEISVDAPTCLTSCAKRDRKFCLITYIDEGRVLDFLRDAEWVHHWSMCTHDKDTDENGKPKEKHTHIVLYTYDAKTCSSILKIFDRFSVAVYGVEKKQNTLVLPCADVVAQYRYLIHIDDPQKHKYDECERLVDNAQYWHKLERTNGLNSVHNNTAIAIFEDMLSGVPTRELIIRYGQNFVINMRHYKQAIVDHLTETGGAIE